jgi:hypothetical protein
MSARASLCTIGQALSGIRSELKRIADALEQPQRPTPSNVLDFPTALRPVDEEKIARVVADAADAQRRDRRIDVPHAPGLPGRPGRHVSKTEQHNYPE